MKTKTKIWNQHLLSFFPTGSVSTTCFQLLSPQPWIVLRAWEIGGCAQCKTLWLSLLIHWSFHRLEFLRKNGQCLCVMLLTRYRCCSPVLNPLMFIIYVICLLENQSWLIYFIGIHQVNNIVHSTFQPSFWTLTRGKNWIYMHFAAILIFQERPLYSFWPHWKNKYVGSYMNGFKLDSWNLQP